MPTQLTSFQNASLKILPAYTHVASLEEALNNPQAIRLLWLEILFNDKLDLTPWQNREEVQLAFRKACSWYTSYRTVIQAVLTRTPLPPSHDTVDQKDYRVFAEALRFVATAPSHN